VEGYFQNSRNPDMYVQFTAKDTLLQAKLLWNNNQIMLIPESSLAFVGKEGGGDEGPIRIRFIKDSAGIINQVQVGNNDLWKRVKEYKPVVKVEMVHTPDQLKAFEGLYQLKGHEDRFIGFSVKDNKLILKQHWDGNEISFVPESPLSFFSKDVPMFSLTFAKDATGNIKQATAFRNDLWIKLSVVHSSLQALQTFEGKYQSKDDPDNVIQLVAGKDQLIVKQLWDKKELTVDQQTDMYFYNSAQNFPLQAYKDKDGKIARIVLMGIDEFDRIK